MDISTANSLGEKLGTLDLDEDEATMLLAMMGFERENEVEGYWSTSGDADDRPTEEVAFAIAKPVTKGFSFGVEREFKAKSPRGWIIIES